MNPRKSSVLLICITGLIFSDSILHAENSPPSAVVGTVSEDLPAYEYGKRIYQEGRLSDGTAITAIAQNDIPLTGTKIICSDCHRKSGFGSSEGGVSVPAVTGSILFEPRNEIRRELYGQRAVGPGSRTAYTDQTFGKAIRDGRDPSGRKLNKLMPRYNISDKELAYLIAYLKSMDSRLAPGVTQSTIHFATIVTPGVETGRANSMLTTLTTYINHLNAGTRSETKRAKFAPWHKTWHYGSYRQWQLHVWRLKGNSDTWQSQLSKYYAQQPVFAVVNGIGTGQWRPIHEFCKNTALPCIFPTTNLPVTAEEDFYTFYFSRGVILEAEAIAIHLAQLAGPKTVVQIHADTQESIAAARTVSQHLTLPGTEDVRSISLASIQEDGLKHTKISIDDRRPTYLILWLNGNNLAKIRPFLKRQNGVATIFFSSSLLDHAIESIPVDFPSNSFLVRQYNPPDTMIKNISRAKSWATARKLQVSDDYAMANAYFAVTITADVIKHLRANLIRDYFVERMEHMIESTVFHSVYPHLSLGPGQRFASKGCYIVGPLEKGGKNLLTAKYDWVVP